MSKLAQAGREKHPTSVGSQAAGALHRLVQIGRPVQGRRALERVLQKRRVPAEEHHRLHMRRHRGAQERKVGPLALSSRDQDQPLLRAESLDCGERRPHIGRLRIVIPAHTSPLRDELAAMGEPAKGAQRLEHCGEGEIDGVSERERGERIGDVVTPRQGQAVRARQSFLPEREPRVIASPGHSELSLARLVQRKGELPVLPRPPWNAPGGLPG